MGCACNRCASAAQDEVAVDRELQQAAAIDVFSCYIVMHIEMQMADAVQQAWRSNYHLLAQKEQPKQPLYMQLIEAFLY